jgi:hypothetical protein
LACIAAAGILLVDHLSSPRVYLFMFPQQPSSRAFSLAAATMALGGLALMASAAMIALRKPPSLVAAQAPLVSCEQRCALPAGVWLADLSKGGADYMAKRAQICADYECSRITREEYAESIGQLDAVFEEPLAERVWATAVREVSSQYGEDDWSAEQVLGSPDVYPSSGDNVHAWASMNQDGKDEFIEVAIPAGRISATEIYETFNPGAIRSIDLISTDGSEHRIFNGAPGIRDVGSRVERTEFTCTSHKMIAVRVSLNASAVPGWNEIDAIAVRPCR